MVVDFDISVGSNVCRLESEGLQSSTLISLRRGGENEDETIRVKLRGRMGNRDFAERRSTRATFPKKETPLVLNDENVRKTLFY